MNDNQKKAISEFLMSLFAALSAYGVLVPVWLQPLVLPVVLAIMGVIHLRQTPGN
jgi:hypothetical protein